MDVYGIFIGDTNLSYGTMRNSVYRDYEKFPYGTFENNNNPTLIDYYNKVQEKCQKTNKEVRPQKQSCPFCQEQKKRPLISYMRKRDFHKHHDKICEEDEEQQNSSPEDETKKPDEENVEEKKQTA